MSRGCNKVKQSMHAVVSESRITLDTGFFCENVVVLPFQVANDLREAANRTCKHPLMIL